MNQVIVTGAAQGIGLAIVRQLVSDGFIVHACDVKQESLDALKQKLQDKVVAHCFDVSNVKEIEEFFSTFESQDRPRNLVNNAGIYLAKNLFDYNQEEIERIFSVNVYGTLQMTKLFAKPLIEQKSKGSIVNIGSVSEHGGSDAVYSSSKGAISSFTSACSINLSPYIRVNTISPGLVKTSMFGDIPDKTLKDYQDKELIKEPILPEDVANTVSFLLSDNAKHYTGTTFDLNNGIYRK